MRSHVGYTLESLVKFHCVKSTEKDVLLRLHAHLVFCFQCRQGKFGGVSARRSVYLCRSRHLLFKEYFLAVRNAFPSLAADQNIS